MHQELITCLKDLGFNQSDIYENNQTIRLECAVRNTIFSCVIQNLSSPEIDIEYGPVNIYRSFGSRNQLIHFLRVLTKDLKSIESQKEDIKFIKRRLLFLTIGWRVDGLENPTVLG